MQQLRERRELTVCDGRNAGSGLAVLSPLQGRRLDRSASRHRVSGWARIRPLCRGDPLSLCVDPPSFGFEGAALNLREASTFHLQKPSMLEFRALGALTTLGLRGAVTLRLGGPALGVSKALSLLCDRALSLELGGTPALRLRRPLPLGFRCALLGKDGPLVRELIDTSSVRFRHALAFSFEGALPLCFRNAPLLGVDAAALDLFNAPPLGVHCLLALSVGNVAQIRSEELPYGPGRRPAAERSSSDRAAGECSDDFFPFEKQRLDASFVAPHGDVVAVVPVLLEQPPEFRVSRCHGSPPRSVLAVCRRLLCGRRVSRRTGGACSSPGVAVATRPRLVISRSYSSS